MLQTANFEALVGLGDQLATAKPIVEQEENPDIGAGDAQTVATNYRDVDPGTTETYDELAFTDTRLRMDVDSIKSYAARANADVVAVNTGDWSSASTWWNFDTVSQSVPTAGQNVLIAKGVTVTYDGNDTTEYQVIRVDGGFEFANDQNVELHCDTIFIDHTGTYELALPTSTAFTQNVVYTNDGALDVTNDPVKMQRGLICFGQATINGTPMQGIARATAGLAQGATSVTLDRQVQGLSGYRDWQVGDQVVIPGTRMKCHGTGASNWEDQETVVVTIDSIDNTTPTAPVISWVGGLANPHPACHLDATKTPHIYNLENNFQTWTKGSPTDPQVRAHQLFKNKDQNTVKYVTAYAMGRTDLDFTQPGHVLNKLSDGPTITSTTNTNGRYTWHFHRNGAQNPLLNPSEFIGCVGYDSPGWMFVHHDSHGNIKDCIAYDFQAVGFVGEGGGTWGEIDGCHAINNRETDEHASTAHIKDGGHTVGALGHGFWSNSRPLKFKNCVASNCTVGMGWSSRVSFGTNVYPGITDEIRAFYGLAALPDTDVQKVFAVIQGFENNEVYACNWGGTVAKKFPVQHHDLVSHMKTFTAWEVDVGFHWQYTGMYVMSDWEVIGFDNSHRTQAPWNPGVGMDPFRQSVAMNFINPRIENFEIGIAFTTVGGNNTLENKAMKVVNPTFVSVTKNYTNGSAEITLPWSSTGTYTDVEEIASGSVGDSSAGAITTTYDEDISVWSGSLNTRNHFVIGHNHTYTDSLGTQPRFRGVSDDNLGFGELITDQSAKEFAETSKDAGILILINKTKMQEMMKAEGVYDSAAGDKVLLIPDVIQDRFSGATTYFYTPVAIRISQSNYDTINPPENGPLGTHGGQDFSTFDPVGTNGLT